MLSNKHNKSKKIKSSNFRKIKTDQFLVINLLDNWIADIKYDCFLIYFLALYLLH